MTTRVVPRRSRVMLSVTMASVRLSSAGGLVEHQDARAAANAA